MGKIILLDDLTINKIAAGEVIERPASAIKEVMENSIDAGATSITVEIKNGGISYIRVTDNGKGIMPDDMEIAFERHATSKLRNADELSQITSMGFRGEALASIAAIAKVTLTSKTRNNEIGYQVIVEGGNIIDKQEIGCQNGTSITIENLFYNTPVRYKFLKKDFTEAGYIEDAVTRIALVHPEIAVKLINTGKTIIQTSGNGVIRDVIYNIFGREIANNLINVDCTYEDIKVEGVVGKPVISRSNRANQLFFVNNRFVKDKTLSSSAEQAFKGLLPQGKHGFLVLNLTMDPRKVDVNVHPAKLEVRFQDESKIFKAVYHSIKEALLNDNNSEEKTEIEKINNMQSKLENINITANKIDVNDYTKTFEPINYDKQNDSTKTYGNEFEPNEKEKKNEETFEQVMAKIQRMQNIVDKVNSASEKTVIESNNYEEKKKSELNIENYTIEKNETNLVNIIKENTEEYNPIPNLEKEPEKETSNNISYIEKNNQNIVEEQQKDNEVNTKQEIVEDEQTGKINNDYDFLKMYEKNFGLAVKPQEEKEKIDVSSEFKPTTGEENLSVFENEEGFKVKPVYKFIGMAFEKYFVIEMQDSLYIIDQKKANERIVYENIKNIYYSSNRNSQLMLLPDIITLTYKQMGIYKDNKEMFIKAGFSIDEFGENTLKISGVPEIIIDLETKDIFLETLEEINTVARTAKQEIEEKFIRCLARNSANKEKKIQNAQEAVELLDKLLILPEPFDVTEGETSAIKMTKSDIEKKFSRRK